MLKKRLVLARLLLGLLLVAALPALAQYPGYGCFIQGNTEVCMTQLTSQVLYALFPDRVADPNWQWHQFMASILTQDDSVEAFRVTLVYEINGERVTATHTLGRWRDGRGPWTSVVFYGPPGSRFVSIRVTSFRTAEVVEAP